MGGASRFMVIDDVDILRRETMAALDLPPARPLSARAAALAGAAAPPPKGFRVKVKGLHE